MRCGSCRNEFLSGTCLSCGVEKLLRLERASERAEAIAEGRREMLWLMAVGCEVLIWQRARMSVTLAERHAGWLRGHALQALADLGDQRAIDILGGER